MGDLNIDTVGSPAVMSADGKDLSIGCENYSNTTNVFGQIAECDITSVVALGSSQADAVILSHLANIVAGSATNTGLLLPAGAPVGRRIYIINRGLGGNVKVYPPSGGKINQLAANAAFTVNSATSAEFMHEGSNKWFVVS